MTVYDRNGFRILLHFSETGAPGHPDVHVLLLTMMSTAPQPVWDIMFQVAVPKVSWSVRALLTFRWTSPTGVRTGSSLGGGQWGFMGAPGRLASHGWAQEVLTRVYSTLFPSPWPPHWSLFLTDAPQSRTRPTALTLTCQAPCLHQGGLGLAPQCHLAVR